MFDIMKSVVAFSFNSGLQYCKVFNFFICYLLLMKECSLLMVMLFLTFEGDLLIQGNCKTL